MEERTLPHLNRENPDMHHHTIFRCRSAFTLVELLAVTVIIAILATFTTMAVNSSVRAAKEAKTRGTILKLDTAIQQIYESYEEKFDNIWDDTVHGGAWQTCFSQPPTDEQKALIRLHMIRDLMRMEMPVTWGEVNHNDTYSTPGNLSEGPIPIIITGNGPSPPTRYLYVERPAVLDFYRRAYQPPTSNTMVPDNAELLFLMIMNLNPEALEGFHESEIGDLDNNGLFEFLDAWGNPIMFIRWAPGLTGSDRQPDIIAHSGLPLGTAGNNVGQWAIITNPAQEVLDAITNLGSELPGTTITDAEWSDPTTISNVTKRNVVSAMQQSVSKHHDPFDAMSQTRSWFLYPVVYSAGPDQLDDLTTNIVLPGSFTWNVNLGNWNASTKPVLDPFLYPQGLPNDDKAPDGSPRNGELNHYDNIHNHRISGGF